MSFIESYKHLDKICGEVLNDDRRISAYIDEMKNTPRGSYLVRGWDDSQIARKKICANTAMRSGLTTFTIEL